LCAGLEAAEAGARSPVVGRALPDPLLEQREEQVGLDPDRSWKRAVQR
jgi:hypothetical protein